MTKTKAEATRPRMLTDTDHARRQIARAVVEQQAEQQGHHRINMRTEGQS